MPEIVTPPSGEPLSVADAKAFVRVETGADDALIASLISTARAAVEARTGRALLLRRLRQRFDAWPVFSVALRLAVRPVPVVHALSVVDATGALVPVDPALWSLDADAEAGRVVLVDRAKLPTPGRAMAGIVVEFSAGSAPEAMAPALVHAVRLLVAHLYSVRDGGPGGDISAVPGLLAPFLEPRL